MTKRDSSNRMTARFLAGVFTMAALVGVGGCGTKEGQRLVEYKAGGDRLQEKKAGEQGRYSLHTGTGRTVTFRVDKGDEIGFRRRGNAVEAFAGDNPSVELEGQDARGAYWQFVQKSER